MSGIVPYDGRWSLLLGLKHLRRRASIVRRRLRNTRIYDRLTWAAPLPDDPYKPVGDVAVRTQRCEVVDEDRGAKLDCIIRAPRGDTGGPQPVVVYSVPPDWQPNSPSPTGDYVMRHLAKAGYVTITVRHVTSDRFIFPAWIGEQRDPRRYLDERIADTASHRQRLLDLPLLFDTMRVWNSDGQNRGLFDLDRIGVCGHSFGAYTALVCAGRRVPPDLASFEDPRLKAVIAYSTVCLGDEAKGSAFADIDVPAFHMTGSDDFAYHSAAPPETKLGAFHVNAATPQYALMLRGAGHDTFGGEQADALTANKREQICHQWIRSATLAFWDAYLREDQAARRWLDEDFERLLGKDGTFWRK